MKTFIGQISKARAAFTLMEVNLAIFIMAVGVLAMTSLYPLGFRESEQSRDDVYAAVIADEVLGKLTAALSSRNITWDEWHNGIEEAVNKTPKGWFSYFKSYNGKGGTDYKVIDKRASNELAQNVFDALQKVSGVNLKLQKAFNADSKYVYGLVAQWGKRVLTDNGVKNDWSRVSISFRMARRSEALKAAPIYYTEVHFQGDQEGMDQ